MDEHTISPAGDPFHAAPHDRGEHPHACTDGLVFLAYVAYDEEIGDEVERLEVVPCRHCTGEASR